ncbi:MAG: hypothetical protein ACTHJ7_07835 [Candidatus Nitrosocosmicus sp.]
MDKLVGDLLRTNPQKINIKSFLIIELMIPMIISEPQMRKRLTLLSK